MKILKVTIIRGNSADKIILDTDLPEGTYPYTGKMSLLFDVAKGNGEDYLSRHFPELNEEDILIVNRI